MDIQEKMVEEKIVAYIPAKGSYDQIMGLFDDLMNEIMAKGIQIAGPPYGVYYNSPIEVPEEELMFEVGVPVFGELKEGNKIKIKKIPKTMVLYTIHHGPYDKVSLVYMSMVDYIMKNGYDMIGAPMEIYLNSPAEVSENELLTEIRFPVIKN